MIRSIAACLLCLPLLWAGMSEAGAHALQPGYLELQLLSQDNWRVFWRKPTVQGKPMDIHARLPENCDRREPAEPRFDGAAWVSNWVAKCPGGITGGEILIDGLSSTRTDVLVRYEAVKGENQTARLTPADPGFVVPEDPGAVAVLFSYLGLGIEHILDGVDHLLFVFALLLLIRDRWRLVGAITAFTVAHSLTLAAAVFGWIVVPGPPVEAVIALSIIFLAVEALKSETGELRLSERWPWVVSFSFGLLHGLGFAGALLDIGLPRTDVPLALLGFNLGVEAGQLLFIAIVVIAGWLVSRILPSAWRRLTLAGGPGMAILCYGIGGIASYWFIERLTNF
jgi:hypothetical protein